MRLAGRAARHGGVAPAALNAANEEAVAAFRAGRIGFLAISEIVARVIDEVTSGAIPANRVTLEDVLETDTWARQRAVSIMEEES